MGIARNALFALLLGLATTAAAHEGHDHNEAVALPQHIEPRFEARADTVEVTGILKADQLWLFVARYPDNTPWRGLKVALEIGEQSAIATAQSPGVYRVAAPALGLTGKHSIVVSLHGAGLDELLNSELVVTSSPEAATPKRRWLIAGAVALAVVTGGALLRRRRQQTP